MQQVTGGNLSIVCNACGARQSHGLDFLHETALLTCPDCGTAIDLRKDPWKGEIQRLWNASHHLGPARRRLP